MIFKEMYTSVHSRCRGEMGGLNYEYAEKVLTNKYGESMMIDYLMEALPLIESMRFEHSQRKTPKPKK